MKKEELLYLRLELQKEQIKRERIKELLQDKSIKELIGLAKINLKLFVPDDIDILLKILENYSLTNTNNIYVCTDAFYYGLEDDNNLLFKNLNSSIYDKRLYKDIENGKTILGCTDRDDCRSFADRAFDEDFNRDNIVLNPYNTRKNNNGYEMVRIEFIENALQYGQDKSKKLLLEKYPRLGGK